MPRVTRIQYVATTIRSASTTGKRPPQPKSSTYRPPPRPSKPAAPIEQPFGENASPKPVPKFRAVPWILASTVAGGLGFYLTRLFIEARRPCQNPAIADLSRQKDVSGRYEYTADSFDSEVGLSEVLMGVNRLRKKMARNCAGDVLEVSCGTGRNIGYFDVGRESKIESLTFVDLHPQMIDLCKKKWVALVGNKNDKLKPGLQVRFLTGSAFETMPSPPAKAKYQTIVQTMGLCSVTSPVELLTNMVRHLDTTNPDARILLLEHGRSYQQWLNRILDNAAEKHAEIHGCWFNRDIGSLVEDAARKTGLEVVNERRHHLGTTWVFELKPSVELVNRPSSTENALSEQLQPSNWLSWLGWK